MNIDEILNQREQTHGKFSDYARIASAFKTMFNAQKVTPFKLTVQDEALDMIFNKIARIGAGDPEYIDHWEDIAGYAMLVAKELKKIK
ncbi:MAG: DUF6378 domain-containing protein [Campylobacter sp.]|nr:DUF6378 domain-containing protein [Campylobacter sp.]